MPFADAEAFLADQLPTKYLAEVPQAFRNAYAAVEGLAKEESILQGEAARINRGHLRAWAVDTAVMRLITSGAWPFEYSWKDYVRPTGKYLCVHLGAATLSVCQVMRSKKVPRPAAFRSNNVMNNSPFLELDSSFEQQNTINGLPHLVLVHGYQTLDFIHAGVPYPNARKVGYIYQTPNLLLMPHIVNSDLPPPEGTEINPEVEILKEELKKWRRDNE